MGSAPTWLRQVSPPPMLHKTTLTTALLHLCGSEMENYYKSCDTFGRIHSKSTYALPCLCRYRVCIICGVYAVRVRSLSLTNTLTNSRTFNLIVIRHLLLSSICVPNMKYIFNRSQVPYKGPKISKWVTFFSSSVSIQRWIMGGHPLLLEWHGSATISIIDWEF